MRILCCLNRDLASSMALNMLLPVLGNHELRVILTERVGGVGSPAGEPSGRRELRIAEQTLPNEVFFPVVERAGLPDDGSRFLTFAEVERYRGIRVSVLGDPNGAAGLAEVRAFAPDLILTIRYGAILKSAAIAIPKLGVLNLHSGLLPRYRGVLATFRALAAGDAEIGCTLHHISDSGIDTGAIVSTARIPVQPGRSLLWHILELYPAGVQLLADALAGLSRGAPVHALAQQAGAGTYYSFPSADDWDQFRRDGWTVADAGDLECALRRYVVMPIGRAPT